MSEQREAGRALDAEIARRFFKVHRLYAFDGQAWDGEDDYPQYIPSGKPWRTHSIDATTLPWFSRDIAPAWQIVERLVADGYDVMVNCGDGGYTRGTSVGEDFGAEADSPEWECALWWLDAGQHRETTQYAETAPLAICRAALAALGAGSTARPDPPSCAVGVRWRIGAREGVSDMANVYDEVRAERDRQDAEWGQEHDDSHHAPDWESLIEEYVEQAFVARVQTGNHDMTGWRRRMIQVAALAVAAVESLDRKGVRR